MGRFRAGQEDPETPTTLVREKEPIMQEETTTNEALKKVGDAGSQVAGQLVDTATSSQNALMDSFTVAYNQAVVMIPKIGAMLIVLIVGYIIARLLGQVIATLCDKIGLQTAAERGGVVASMKQVGIQRTVPQILGTIVFWLLMAVFVMAAFQILGLEAVTQAMQQVVAYIPKLLVATIVVVVGLLLATFLRGVVATSADRVGLTYAEHLANGVYYVLFVMTFMAALGQLGIEFELLNRLILIAFAGIALGFGLAFGLGGRDVMGGILAGYYLRQRLQSGDQVSVAGFEGTVREVGPVATVIETEDGGLLHRHSIPNGKMLSEAVR
jgi:hypothetical protein